MANDGKFLFEAAGDYLVPQANSHVRDNRSTRAYYVAVGRILLYCLGQKIPIAAHVLVSQHCFSLVRACCCISLLSNHLLHYHLIRHQPDLYKRYLLQDISPNDMEYPLRDLVSHVFELFTYEKHILNDIESDMKAVLEPFCQYNSGEATEKQFRSFVYEHFIKDRSVALTSLKKGITLDGKRDVSE